MLITNTYKNLECQLVDNFSLNQTNWELNISDLIIIDTSKLSKNSFYGISSSLVLNSYQKILDHPNLLNFSTDNDKNIKLGNKDQWTTITHLTHQFQLCFTKYETNSEDLEIIEIFLSKEKSPPFIAQVNFRKSV